ncbi:aspartate/glutamate racemase family protein [Parapedobacter sp. 2B3]|uniref:aspartate/glutamate racemase family protein n=1 Tax=Parapedobacter sp. 2B3 TaxID=3342381 RepID=UPI000FA01072|nr:MAG: Asp/Glu racemase [Parapedobacter sp.]
MRKKKLALIHTVNWYNTVINKPFGEPWLQQHPDVEIFNLMDDSLLVEALANGGPTKQVIRRMLYYFQAAEAMGADVIMSTCTTMGPATEIAKQFVGIPVFNIDEPMAEEAVAAGSRIGIIATVPTSAPATQRVLRQAAAAAGKEITIKTVINEAAFQYRLAGNIKQHDKLIHAELDKLQREVDVIALGQISLAQVLFKANVPVLQVGDSGFAYAGALLKAVK